MAHLCAVPPLYCRAGCARLFWRHSRRHRHQRGDTAHLVLDQRRRADRRYFADGGSGVPFFPRPVYVPVLARFYRRFVYRARGDDGGVRLRARMDKLQFFEYQVKKLAPPTF